MKIRPYDHRAQRSTNYKAECPALQQFDMGSALKSEPGNYCGFPPMKADGRSTHANGQFTESQIVQILAEYNAGASMEELARRNGVRANTIRLWRSTYAGMSASDLSQLKELAAENAQMQRIIARQTVKIGAIAAHAKKLLEPSRRAEAVKALQEFGLSQREACKSVHARHRSPIEPATTKAQRDASVATRLTQVAQAHGDHGCRRLYYDYERNAICGDEYMNF